MGAEISEQEEPQSRTDMSRGAAAMTSGILVDIQAEVTCPLCLELLTEPMSLDCGHSFCQACITANNKESVNGQESSCPMCRISYRPENMRPNRHAANIAQIIKLSPQEEQKRDLCVHHGKELELFCKEDEKIICWLCERSQEHHGHHTCLTKVVAQEYKDQIENELKAVQHCFKQLREILDSEEQKELQKLEKVRGDVLNILAQAGSEVFQQRQLLRDLISDLEHLLQGSTLEILQAMKGTMERSKTFTLKKPETFSKKQSRMFQGPDQRRILRVFNELRDVHHYWARHVTLDHPMDKTKVVITEEQRKLTPAFHWKTIDLCQRVNYEDYGVLGSPCITSGKHYWEVDVSKKHAWVLGVYGEKYTLSNRMNFVSQLNNPQHVCSRFQPKYGYWVIGLESNSEYNAFLDSSSSNPLKLTLSLTVPPRRVGVLLDYDARTVSFFNVTNHGFLIYKFSSCSFSQNIHPYFNTMKCPNPLKLCSPSS
ncbi:tripartite motif-containing protein 5-like isoform X2 [Myotis yumanensis]|uniref:tripartite motif-containing protein 5-like isoform X2 n=1 Tax=Myotis yumanensis TaxID=159337 RepID=UPI0038D36CEE